MSPLVFSYSVIRLSVLGQAHASSKASSPKFPLYCFLFHFTVPSLSLRSSSDGLRLLPLLLVTSTFPSIFHSITCLRRQFLRKMWPIKLTFLLFIVLYAILLLLTYWNPSWCLKWSIQPISNLLLHFLKCPSLSTTQSFTPNVSIL
jgi:hypothetical protein